MCSIPPHGYYFDVYGLVGFNPAYDPGTCCSYVGLSGLAECRGLLFVVRPLGLGTIVKITTAQPNNRSCLVRKQVFKTI